MSSQIILQIIIDGLLLGGFYALMAEGLSIIFGTLRIINLAHGDFIVLGAYTTWYLTSVLGLSLFITLPVVLIIGFLLGIILGKTLIRPVIGKPDLIPLLLTFGIATLIQGALAYQFTVSSKLITSPYSASTLSLFGVSVSAAKGIMCFTAIILLCLLAWFLTYTRIGRAIKATAENHDAARIVGIRINSIYTLTFGIGIAITFITGALFGVAQGFNPFTGPLFTLKAFVIVIVGGYTTIRGTLYAGFFIGLVETALSTLVPSYGTSLGIMAAFVLVVVVLIIRPTGIFRA